MVRFRLATLIIVSSAISSAADFNKDDALKRKTEILKRFVDEFVVLSPGTDKFPQSFVRGSDKDGADNERPVHKVTLKTSFAMAKYEVTQELFFVMMGTNP